MDANKNLEIVSIFLIGTMMAIFPVDHIALCQHKNVKPYLYMVLMLQPIVLQPVYYLFEFLDFVNLLQLNLPISMDDTIQRVKDYFVE